MFSNRSISIPALVFLGICGFSTAGFAATYGDLNCDASVNVVDVQISILKTLGEPLDVVIDGDGNGIPDACDAEITGTCGEGTIALDGECVIDPAALQGVADTAYADGYADGIAAADLMGSYADGYDDALGMCVELGGSTGACTNYSDLAALDGMTDEVMDSIWSGCFQSCFFSEDTKGCLDDCVSEAAGLTSECGACFASGVQCLLEVCATQCIDPLSEDCAECSSEYGCDQMADACSGLPTPPDPATIGACENDEDASIVATFVGFEGLPTECTNPCLFSEDPLGCYQGCYEEIGLSLGCSTCYGEYTECQINECLNDCLVGFETCDLCSDEAGCNAELDACANGNDTPPPNTGSCLELYECVAIECAGEPECANQCGLQSSPEALQLYTDWGECVYGYADESGAFPTDGMGVLAPYFLCIDKFATCVTPAGFQTEGSCDAVTECLAGCGDDADCIADCTQYLGYAASASIASVTKCAYETCMDLVDSPMEGFFGNITECVVIFSTGQSMPGMPPGCECSDPTPGCDQDEDCDDGDPCTIESCEQGFCQDNGVTEECSSTTIETCNDLYNCIYVDCEGQAPCANNCFIEAPQSALFQYEGWVNCALSYADPEGAFPSEAMGVLGPYYLCLEELAACVGPDTFGDEGGCIDTTECLGGCGGDAQCIGACTETLTGDSVQEIASVVNCAYDVCTDESNPLFVLLESIFDSTAECITAGVNPGGLGGLEPPCGCEVPIPPMPTISGMWILESEIASAECFFPSDAFEIGPRTMSLTISESGDATAYIEQDETVVEYNGSFEWIASQGTYVLTLEGNPEVCVDTFGINTCAPTNEKLNIPYDFELESQMYGSSTLSFVPGAGMPECTVDYDIYAFSP